ncbi:arabinogalactan protein 1-like [Miscanthus floridulus]|uniref:arabinogalactan protein 1-like n=1 Tax=Miscanthus floridulus TaxID=154761 RepID=UPI00345A8E05
MSSTGPSAAGLPLLSSSLFPPAALAPTSSMSLSPLQLSVVSPASAATPPPPASSSSTSPSPNGATATPPLPAARGLAPSPTHGGAAPVLPRSTAALIRPFPDRRRRPLPPRALGSPAEAGPGYGAARLAATAAPCSGVDPLLRPAASLLPSSD